MLESPREVTKFEETIIGESPQIKRVIDETRKIAETFAITTLVIGESGTGKELIARLLHNLSSNANQPFIDINCGVIPESLLESELFGYEKGAFTGAHMKKQGLFELANGGTVFLDEIGNTNAKFQMKLLKAVENKKFRRLGGLKEIEISTRIIAAANIDLSKAVRENKFREDLYYRLNVFQISIPPLRERENDILILAEHFINYFNREYDRQVKGLTSSAKKLLLEYSWPGNIRQLKNAIERAVLVETDDWIKREHFSLDIDRKMNRIGHVESKRIFTETKPIYNYNRFEIPDEGISLEELEKDLIMNVLDKANGNLSRAARLLKISRGKLRYKLEKLDLRPKENYPPKSYSAITN